MGVPMPFQCRSCGLLLFQENYPHITSHCPARPNKEHDWFYIKKETTNNSTPQPDYDALAATITKQIEQKILAREEAYKEPADLSYAKMLAIRVESKINADQQASRENYRFYNKDFKETIETFIRNADIAKYQEFFREVLVEFKTYSNEIKTQFIGDSSTEQALSNYDIFKKSLRQISEELSQKLSVKGLPIDELSISFKELSTVIDTYQFLPINIDEPIDLISLKMPNPSGLEHMEKLREKSIAAFWDTVDKSCLMRMDVLTHEVLQKTYKTLLMDYQKAIIDFIPENFKYAMYCTNHYLTRAQGHLKKALAKGYEYDDLRSSFRDISYNFRRAPLYYKFLLDDLVDVLQRYDHFCKILADRLSMDENEVAQKDEAIREQERKRRYEEKKAKEHKEHAFLLILAQFAVIGLAPLVILFTEFNILLAVIIPTVMYAVFEHILQESFSLNYIIYNPPWYFNVSIGFFWVALLPYGRPFSYIGFENAGFGLNYTFLICFMLVKIFLVRRKS